MRIGELARRTGLTVHTIRYYERIGLLPRVARNASRHRDYDEGILVWIAFVHRLRTTRMPISDMVRYARLRDKGAGTARERRALLVAHRDAVRVHLAELRSSLSVLDAKIAGYAVGPTKTETDDGSKRSGARALRGGPEGARSDRRSGGRTRR